MTYELQQKNNHETEANYFLSIQKKLNGNNLITSIILKPLIEICPDFFLEEIDKIVSEIRFCIGGSQRKCHVLPKRKDLYEKYKQKPQKSLIKKYGLKAIKKRTSYAIAEDLGIVLKKNKNILILPGYHEFDTKKNIFYFYLFQIYKDARKLWNQYTYAGSFRREIFYQLYSQFMKCLAFLYQERNFIRQQKKFLKANEIQQINREFNAAKEVDKLTKNSDLPINMGFLDIQYYNFMDLKGVRLKKGWRQCTNAFFTEMRRLKLKYEYEHSFSELIYYCIYGEPSRVRIERNIYNCKIKWYKNSLYSKYKRILIKYLKEIQSDNHIKEYRDSANREHLFLSHEMFEQIKEKCRMMVLDKIGEL